MIELTLNFNKKLLLTLNFHASIALTIEKYDQCRIINTIRSIDKKSLPEIVMMVLNWKIHIAEEIKNRGKSDEYHKTD